MGADNSSCLSAFFVSPDVIDKMAKASNADFISI